MIPTGNPNRRNLFSSLIPTVPALLNGNNELNKSRGAITSNDLPFRDSPVISVSDDGEDDLVTDSTNSNNNSQ